MEEAADATGVHEDAGTYVLYQQGRDRLRRGNPGGAAEVLELAIEQAPEQASLHEALGRAYFAGARLTAARRQFERAVELDPTDDYAHYVLGRTLERQGELERAAKHLKLACAMSPKPDYRDARDRVLQRLS